MYIRSKMFLIVTLVIMSPGILLAETTETEGDTLSGGMGFAAGLVSGVGFSFRFLPQEGMGMQITSIFVDSGNNAYFNVGVQSLLTFHRGPQSALYGLVGLGFHTTGSDASIAGGVGLGYGYLSRGRIWSSFDLVMTASDGAFLPYPQMAVHYMLW